MRRSVLPSMLRYFKRFQNSNVNHLDIATGTGRFISFALDNFPQLDLTVLDLSPFYLAEAKKILRQYPQVVYAEASAESLPFPDASFDSLSCVYLFHELPSDVRLTVLKEMFRVLKPGGKLFFVDSAQQGDVPYLRVLHEFTAIAHEPYYLEYTECDLVKLFESQGFLVEDVIVSWVSKAFSATKPFMK